jgi:hypothetical protein
MCQENPTSGAPRIHGELLKLGINIAESSVSKYMVRRYKPPSQSWRTFLENHAPQLVSIDFFTVPTIHFQVLYVFLVLAHGSLSKIRKDLSRHELCFFAILPSMPAPLLSLLVILRSLIRSRVDLHLENLALRYQIGVLQRSVKNRTKLTSLDRLLWVSLSRIWRDWRSALAIVKPKTVVAWHRKGFLLVLGLEGSARASASPPLRPNHSVAGRLEWWQQSRIACFLSSVMGFSGRRGRENNYNPGQCTHRRWCDLVRASPTPKKAEKGRKQSGLSWAVLFVDVRPRLILKPAPQDLVRHSKKQACRQSQQQAHSVLRSSLPWPQLRACACRELRLPACLLAALPSQ